MPDKRTQVKAELLLLFSAAVWAGTFVIIKHALSELTPFCFLAIRFGFASAVFLILSYKHLYKTTGTEIKAGILLGLLLFFGIRLADSRDAIYDSF